MNQQFMVLEDAVTRTEEKMAAQVQGLLAVQEDVNDLREVVNDSAKRMDAQLGRIVEVVQVLANVKNSSPAAPLNQRPDRGGEQFFHPNGLIRSKSGSFAGDVRPDPTPLSATASAESMTKHAVVDAKLSETLLARGESDELFKTGTVVPAEVVRSTRDMFVGSSTEVTNDISQLKFLHAP